MGDTSMNCALTGLEVADGDEVYAVVVNDEPDRYRGHLYRLPPVKGVYDGFGRLEMTETLIGLETEGHRAGDIFPPEEHHTNTVFVRAEVFEALDGLSEAETLGTIGASVEEDLAEFRAHISQVKGSLGVFSMATAPKALMQSMRWLDDRSPWLGAFNHLKKERLIQKTDDEFFMLLRRSKVLKAAEFELRRPITNVRRGPQHGGHEALKQMNDLVGQIVEAKIQQVEQDILEEENGMAP
ncbi:hypothetical protein [Sulfitobacter sp. R18_1]|uniref:hypothetical protein n=1 Tax=Sulfitobacter sp. R18_1 TaxID=2821104 RepID=UPI001ADB0CDB|nr:hypothetical protein [Sulfitobacter sp. R18_1]MBO9428135.1 hypothetical protein [Sulfitobacter sp. R18_1]